MNRVRETAGPRGRTAAITAAALALALIGVIATPLAAAADGLSTTTAFLQPRDVSVQYGDDWVLPIRVTTNEYPITLDASYGTVDVYIEGISGAYAAALPLAMGGMAYFAQPTGQPALAAGSYTITAIFEPAAGSGVSTSQTTAPATLTIAPLDVVAQVTVSDDPSVAPQPVITAALSGSYVAEKGGAPGGTWAFTVTNASGKTVFEQAVDQVAGAEEPLTVTVDKGIRPGEKYSVASVFTLTASIAPGITLTAPKPTTFTSAEGSFSDALAAPIAVPVWVLVLIVITFSGLIAAMVQLIRRTRNRWSDAEIAPVEPEPFLAATVPDGVFREHVSDSQGESEAPAGDEEPRATSPVNIPMADIAGLRRLAPSSSESHGVTGSVSGPVNGSVSGAQPRSGWALSDDEPAQ